MNKLFFLHTHYVPKAIIDECCLTGAVIVPEFYANLNKFYWGVEKSYNNIVDYLHDKEFIEIIGTQTIFSVENINMITNVNILPTLKEYGVKIVQLFHNKDNRYFSLQRGLTHEGIKLLNYMEKSDMILDLSHIPDGRIYEVTKAYKGRKIVSHCACSDLYKYETHRSNSLKKSTLEYLAKENAIIGLAFINDIISSSPYSEEENDITLLNDLVDQISYISSIISVSKLALGPDFIDLSYFSNIFGVNLKIADCLLAGYGFEQLRLILLKKNFLNKDIDNIFCDNVIKFLSMNL